MAVNTPYTHRVNLYEALSTTQPRYVAQIALALDVHKETLNKHARWLIKHGYAQRTSKGMLRIRRNTADIEKLARDEQANVSLERLGLRLCATCGQQRPIEVFMQKKGPRRVCKTCLSRAQWKRMHTQWTPEQLADYRRRNTLITMDWKRRHRDRERVIQAAYRERRKQRALAARLATVRVIRRDRQEVA